MIISFEKVRKMNIIIGILIIVISIVLIALFGVLRRLGIIKRKYIKRIRKNQIDNNFKQTYDFIVRKYGYELEILRKRVIHMAIYESIITVLIGVIITFSKTGKNITILVPFFASIFCITQSLFYKKYGKEYRKSFKENVIKNLLDTLKPHFIYKPDGVEYDYYLKANFNMGKKEYDSKRCDTIDIKDYISGIMYNNKIEMSNISFQDKSNSKYPEDVQYETIFSMIIATIHMNKNVDEEIRISKNKVILKNKNNVLMDSTEFERYFDVYSSNKILTMQFLTTDVLSLITDFYQKYKINMEIVIREDKIYIGFDTGVVFEPHIFQKSIDIKTLWIYYSILNFTIQLSGELSKISNDTSI